MLTLVLVWNTILMLLFNLKFVLNHDFTILKHFDIKTVVKRGKWAHFKDQNAVPFY